MRRAPLPIRFHLEGRPVGGEVLALRGGPRILVLTTNCAHLDLSLHASYVGDDRLDVILVSEAAEMGDSGPELYRRELADAAGTFTYQRRRLLYDHLQRVQGFAFEYGYVELQIDGVDAAAGELDPLATH